MVCIRVVVIANALFMLAVALLLFCLEFFFAQRENFKQLLITHVFYFTTNCCSWKTKIFLLVPTSPLLPRISPSSNPLDRPKMPRQSHEHPLALLVACLAFSLALPHTLHY